MHVGSLVPILVFSLGIGTSAFADSNLPWEYLTPFREGTIYYQVSGTQKGTEVLYIKDYGRLRVKQSDTAMAVLDKTVNTRTRELITPQWIIRYNLSDNRGEKNTNPARLYQQEYERLSPAEKTIFAANAAQLGPSLFDNAGSIVFRNSGSILGFACDQVAFGGFSSSCLMHNTDIPLQAESKFVGMVNRIKAVRIDLVSPVPEELFTPLTGIRVTVNEEAEAMLRQAIHQAVQALKEEDGLDRLQQQARQFLPEAEKQATHSAPVQQSPPDRRQKTLR